MHPHPHPFIALKAALADRQLWHSRATVLAFGLFSGLAVIGFTILSEWALALFHQGRAWQPWMPLVWTPLCAALIVWVTRNWAAGAAGSGIPQVLAGLDCEDVDRRGRLFVSIRLSLAKVLLTVWGLLAGLSLGREGPSVQIGAGVMLSARRWLPARSDVTDHGLLVAGGAAGIAAAFNTPLGGILFAIEELSRHPDQRNHGLLMAAIILAGLVGISAFGSAHHFGAIQVRPSSWDLLLPGLALTVTAGVLGGLLARLLIASLRGDGQDRWSRWRRAYPIRFAAGCGLAVAVIGWVSGGATFGSGYATTRELLERGGDPVPLYVMLKIVATWLTAWSGVPGGIFAPSLAIGGALGGEWAGWFSGGDVPTLIAMGMVAFLAAVTHAPLTAFIIVMEMVDGYSLVFSLMACALVSNWVSRIFSPPLYPTLAGFQQARSG